MLSQPSLGNNIVNLLSSQKTYSQYWTCLASKVIIWTASKITMDILRDILRKMIVEVWETTIHDPKYKVRVMSLNFLHYN